MVPLAIGLGLGAASSVAGHIGAKKEAERKEAAIANYNAESSKIYDQMVKDAWAQGMEGQAGTGKVLEGMRGAMSTPGSAAPNTFDFLPEDMQDAGRGSPYQDIMLRSIQPRAGVDQSHLDATQAGMDRQQLARILDELGFSSTIEQQAKDPQHKRYQWKKQRQLAEAEAALQAALGSAGNGNWDLLSSALGLGAQGAMMYGAMGGGAAAAPGVAGAVSPGVAAAAPTSVYAYL